MIVYLSLIREPFPREYSIINNNIQLFILLVPVSIRWQHHDVLWWIWRLKTTDLWLSAMVRCPQSITLISSQTQHTHHSITILFTFTFHTLLTIMHTLLLFHIFTHLNTSTFLTCTLGLYYSSVFGLTYQQLICMYLLA